MPTEKKHILSIAICTNDRLELLQSCLNSLYPQLNNEVELIVINNGKADLSEMAIHFSKARFYSERKKGLSFARNCALKNCKGIWLGFIDDDALARPNLIEKVFQFITNHSSISAFGGRYLPWYKYGKPDWFTDDMGSSIQVQKNRGLMPEGFFPGGISFWNKSDLEKINGFPTDLGMSGDKVSYGEEVYAQIKLRKRGLHLGYDPEIIIEHLVPEHKLNFNWLYQSSFALGRDSYRFNKELISPVLKVKILIKTIIDSIRLRIKLGANYSENEANAIALRKYGYARGRLAGLFKN